MLGLAIQRRLERGTSDEKIDELVGRYKRDAGLLFTVDTLEFLQKGGRIGKAAAFAGTLLHIKPILTIKNGEVLPVKRVRGNQKAVQEFARAFTEGSRDTPNLHVGIAHADAPEREQALRALVADLRPRAQIDVATTLGAVVGTHAGPGTVGFFWFEDDLAG
jgi:DegV family protein with EDD domain